MSPPRLISLALVASFCIHLGLVLLIPAVRLRLPVSHENLVEVEVSQPESSELPPPVKPELPKPEPPLPAEPELPKPEPPPRVVSVPAPVAAEQLAVLEQVLTVPPRATAPPAAAVPRLQLPQQSTVEPNAESLVWTPPFPPVEAPLAPMPVLNSASELPPGPDRQAGEAVAESLLQQLRSVPPSVVPETLTPLRPLEIEGPVGRERQVVDRPSFPRVDIRHPADVRIRFFVSPRGEVVRAFPVERGDAELDRAALEYVKSFTFNALPHDDDREQWGTIRVRFRLQ